MQKIILSPMAGITDAPFRHIARKYGVDATISEMVTAQTTLWGSNKSQQRLNDAWLADDKTKINQIESCDEQYQAVKSILEGLLQDD